MSLPVVPSTQEPLCQQGGHSCAACCGIYNFADRSMDALHQRLARRTGVLTGAGWDAGKLAMAAEELSKEEDPLLLFRAVRTCPFVGFLDGEKTRVGCSIHPLRHPQGLDLRDLGAYRDHLICDGHLCAPHQWLSAADREFLAAAPSWRAYSMAVGESGFVKAVLRHVSSRRGAELKAGDLVGDGPQDAARAVLALFDGWRFADPDPRRFGGFAFAGDEAYSRTAPSMARFADIIAPQEAIMLDALGTLVPDEAAAREAVEALRRTLEPLIAAVELP